MLFIQEDFEEDIDGYLGEKTTSPHLKPSDNKGLKRKGMKKQSRYKAQRVSHKEPHPQNLQRYIQRLLDRQRDD